MKPGVTSIEPTALCTPTDALPVESDRCPGAVAPYAALHLHLTALRQFQTQHQQVRHYYSSHSSSNSTGFVLVRIENRQFADPAPDPTNRAAEKVVTFITRPSDNDPG